MKKILEEIKERIQIIKDTTDYHLNNAQENPQHTYKTLLVLKHLIPAQTDAVTKLINKII